MLTRGSRRTAGTRARWLLAVSQNRPSRKTKFMITPSGCPSLLLQMNVHSVWLLEELGFGRVAEPVDRDVFVVFVGHDHPSGRGFTVPGSIAPR